MRFLHSIFLTLIVATQTWASHPAPHNCRDYFATPFFRSSTQSPKKGDIAFAALGSNYHRVEILGPDTKNTEAYEIRSLDTGEVLSLHGGRISRGRLYLRVQVEGSNILAPEAGQRAYIRGKGDTYRDVFITGQFHGRYKIRDTHTGKELNPVAVGEFSRQDHSNVSDSQRSKLHSPMPKNLDAEGNPVGPKAEIKEGAIFWYRSPRSGIRQVFVDEVYDKDRIHVTNYDEASGKTEARNVHISELVSLSPEDTISNSNQGILLWNEKVKRIALKLRSTKDRDFHERREFDRAFVDEAKKKTNLEQYIEPRRLPLNGKEGVMSTVIHLGIGQGEYFRPFDPRNENTSRTALAYAELAKGFENPWLAPASRIVRVILNGKVEIGTLTNGALGDQGIHFFYPGHRLKPTPAQIDDARAFALIIGEGDPHVFNLFYDPKVGFQFIDPHGGLQPIAARPDPVILNQTLYGIGHLPPDHFSPELVQRLRTLREKVPSNPYLSRSEKESRILHIDALLELAAHKNN